MSDNNGKIGIQDKKPSIKSKVIAFVSKRKVMILGAVLLLAAFAILGTSLYKKSQNDKSIDLTNDANSLGEKGNFNGSTLKLIEAYNVQQKDILKAGIAYKIGVNYFEMGSAKEGKKWMQIAADHFRKAGDTASESNTKHASARFEANLARERTNSVKNQQKAESRKNDPDSNL